MAGSVTSGRLLAPSAPRAIRILRWTFRRGVDLLTYELGLDRDDCAYELTITTPDPDEVSPTEVFVDVVAAFTRQAAIERALLDDGWSLESFETAEVVR